MPGSLRADAAPGIYGLDNLSQKDQDRVQLGNKLVLWSIRLLKCCIKHRVPVVIENPRSSRLRLLPPLQVLLNFAQLDTFDACQYWAPCRKVTQLAAWNFDVSSLSKRCRVYSNVEGFFVVVEPIPHTIVFRARPGPIEHGIRRLEPPTRYPFVLRWPNLLAQCVFSGSALANT
jgi:hypothetical protein